LRAIDQPDRQAGIRKPRGDQGNLAGLADLAQRYGSHLGLGAIERRGISRHDNTDIGTEMAESERKRRADIRETAGFGQREDFSGCEENSHEMDPIDIDGPAHDGGNRRIKVVAA